MIQRKVTRATRRSRVSDSEEKNGEKKEKKRKRAYVQILIVFQLIIILTNTEEPWSILFWRVVYWISIKNEQNK